MSLFARTFRLLVPYRGQVALGLLCVLLSAAAALSMPVLLGRAVDTVASLARSEGDPDGDRLFWLCALIFAVGSTETILKMVARRKLIHASRRVEGELKNQLMGHLGRLPVAWFDRAQTGDLISRFTQDVELLRFVIGPMLLHGVGSLLVVPGGIYMMATLSWQVFVSGLLVFAVLIGSILLVMPKMHEHSKAVQESIAAISQRCAESFGGIRVLMTFGRAPAETATMGRMCSDYMVHNVDLGRMRAVLNLLIHSCRELVVLAVLVLGAQAAIAGDLTIGELFQSWMLIGVMVWPLIALSWLLGTLPRAMAAAERVEEVFAVAPEPVGGEATPLTGRLEVRGLTFRHEGATRDALSDVSFTLEPGQKLGLIGPIGSGKSTLLDLLLRIYEPPRGTMFLDGTDLCDIEPSVLRGTFAVAPQDPFLFSDSIRGNIAFGADDEDLSLDQPVFVSAVDADMDAYPDGLETVVGERGLTLSGGQKQRVSLARALAADRPVVLLDDTLSAVDHHTEAQILERLRTHRSTPTAIVATHRLSAIVDADLVLVLDGGRVIERGTPGELRAADGYYAKAWRRQRERSALEGGED